MQKKSWGKWLMATGGVLMASFVCVAVLQATNYECDMVYRTCQNQARIKAQGNPCDRYMACTQMEQCSRDYCICKRAGQGHLGSQGTEVDPAVLHEAQMICGLTHRGGGSCDRLADGCIDYMNAKKKD